MGVFFRTGEGSAVSFPWPVYLFVILPVQMMWWFAKFLVIVFAAAAAAVIFAAHWAWAWWNERRPPHPEG